jgi:hypothetical protein
MSARTIKNPTTVSGSGNLSSKSLTLSNNVNCVLTSNSAGELLANGVPVGGGGGGAVNAVVAGDGISAVTVDGDVTVSNTGVLSVVGGTGITASTVDGSTTVSNDGVLALTAGTNISITGTKDNLTINNTAASTGVSSIIAGDGISVNQATGAVTITNTVSTAGFLTTASASATYETIANANATFQPIGDYITSPYSNYMFIATYSTPFTIQPGAFKQVEILPNPTFSYTSTQTYEVIAVPIYTEASLPMTIFSMSYSESGSGKGAISLFIQNNNAVPSTINSVNAYAFRII